MKLIVYLLMLICLASCQPQRQLARLIKRHPELVKTDTVIQKIRIHDSIVIPGTRIDTSFYAAWRKDTSFGSEFLSDTTRKKTVLDVTKDKIHLVIQQSGRDKYDVSVLRKQDVIRKDTMIPVPVIHQVVKPDQLKGNAFRRYIRIALPILILVIILILIVWIIKWWRVL